MARTKEFIKESEARILLYLDGAAKPNKYGGKLADKLRIDYVYVMKLLEAMYEKGWVRCHRYNGATYFEVTNVAPVRYAKKRLTKPQQRLRT